MNLLDITTFVKIASHGSLSSVARQQGVSTVAISRSLSALEKELAVRLFHRTTRSLSLTSEGEAFLPYAQSILETKEAAESALKPTAGAVGILKITAPVVFGQTVINPLIQNLLTSHPLLNLDLVFTDNIVDIVGQGMDLAIRIAPIKNSSLVAKKLANNRRLICASPQYLATHGTPKSLDELKLHGGLILHGMEYWPFDKDGYSYPTKIKGRLHTSSLDTIRIAAINGVGIALMTYWDVRQHLLEGSLIEIELNDASLDDLAIWAVFPTRHYIPERVKVFLDSLQKALNAAECGWQK
ncbi:MAG: LysR family transcriptional regulator [Alteromonadaceae bacterium]|jgi:DNA-binding transcriptional LysR family regulator|uniref:LysR family transcriptional regulator n=1 Tax=unclassified Methylophaga TaxID=2629249 RepID=UPI000C6A5455|nr:MULTISPECIES: LysR family transcriptional regulator [unclassified Methylophaga]MAP27012.1 LysR family transcriptional regulator [Methylophaga sp.]MBN24778.1 LysR family transcriptional regulator [Alteromonadaceae bacterium]|tara:strand:- start:11928 stop:12821 length:894 start_codon:yes stop_codon:yes gene_type:complete